LRENRAPFVLERDTPRGGRERAVIWDYETEEDARREAELILG
jgi:hypothetical protein